MNAHRNLYSLLVLNQTGKIITINVPQKRKGQFESK
jgi:transposase-like protein